jgi:hypothetical protein
MTHYQTKKKKKQCPPTILFYFSENNVFLPKIKFYFAIIVQEVQKITFL